MAPIYNPPASSAAIDSDEQYFTDLGLLSGLSKIVSATGGETFPTPSEVYGTTAAVSSNCLKWESGTTNSWQGYDLTGAPFTRLLTIIYVYQSVANYEYLIHNKEDLDNANDHSGDDFYLSSNSPSTTNTLLYKRVSATWSAQGADTTLYAGKTPIAVPSDPTFGWAWYTSYIGGVGSQRMWMKMGTTSEWMQTLAAADTDLQEFRSVALWTLGRSERIVTPFTIWGG